MWLSHPNEWPVCISGRLTRIKNAPSNAPNTLLQVGLIVEACVGVLRPRLETLQKFFERQIAIDPRVQSEAGEVNAHIDEGALRMHPLFSEGCHAELKSGLLRLKHRGHLVGQAAPGIGELSSELREELIPKRRTLPISVEGSKASTSSHKHNNRRRHGSMVTEPTPVDQSANDRCTEHPLLPESGLAQVTQNSLTIAVMETVNLWYTLAMMNGYARVSTADQSLDRQVDELKAAGAERIYSEVGSGKKGADRPKWDELLRSLRPGDTLMVTELSRLGRSTSQLSTLADDLAKGGIDLRILNLGIDTSTSGGRLVYTIISGVAEMERNLLIERTNSGLAAARARGRKGGRKREFSPKAVRKAQELYDKGDLSVTEIARLAGVSRQTLYRYLDVSSSQESASVG